MLDFDNQRQQLRIVIHASREIGIVRQQVQIREQTDRRSCGNRSDLQAAFAEEFREKSLCEAGSAFEIVGNIAGGNANITGYASCDRSGPAPCRPARESFCRFSGHSISSMDS